MLFDSQRKEYVPLSMLQLQRIIDLGRVDTSKPIDLTALCNSKLVEINLKHGHYGVHLTDEVTGYCKLSAFIAISFLLCIVKSGYFSEIG